MVQPIHVLIAVLCVLAAGAAPAQRLQLPDFGDSSAAVFSGLDDARLGEAFLREVRASSDALEDAEVQAYVDRLGYRLVQASDAGARSFTFLVLRAPTINAFAGPGGVIGLNSGLILAAESESELAAVLAHEIAHVTQRHLARAIQMQDQASIPAMAGMLAAILVASQNAEAGQAAMAAVVGTGIQRQIDFTRANEREADRLGIHILTRADFDPRAMADFFEQLQTSQRFYRVPPEFLSTHPVTTDRVAESRSLAEREPYRQFQDSAAFQRVKARLRVLVHGPREALATFERQIADGTGRSLQANRYGRALALSALDRHAEAVAPLRALADADPDALAVRDALGRALHGAGDTDAALRLYREALRVYLFDRILTLGLAELLMDIERPAEVEDLLTEYLRHDSTDAVAYRLLAEAHDRLGQQAASAAALAEYHYLNGRLAAAVQQLERGQQVGDGNYYLAARIDARLETLRAERTERDER